MVDIASTPEPSDQIPSQRLLREQRRFARDLARRRVADALAPILAEPPPYWLTAEQASAYAAELRRLYQRIAPPSRARARGPA